MGLNGLKFYSFYLFRYYSVIPEERVRQSMTDPFCELFPKMAACHYHRYGMGGREDDRHAICILGLNMVNDKVFVLIWLWHCFIVFMGVVRLLTRSPQLVSSEVRITSEGNKEVPTSRVHPRCANAHNCLGPNLGR